MKNNTSFKISKTTMLVPLFALSMHSCSEVKEVREIGVVKDKIDNQVYLTPVNDTDNVYRVIDFEKACNDKKTKNIYLNISRGDTIEFRNNYDNVEILASRGVGGIIGNRILYNIISINGVWRDSLPDLLYKQKRDAEIKELNKRYNNLHRQH